MPDTKLSVNINKVALIRNSRGENLPDLIQFAQDCESYGAQGITVHPRPDERHIRYQDVYDLKKVVKTELNVEGYPSRRFMTMVQDVRPDQCTLVPDPPGVLTSNEGWKVSEQKDFLTQVISDLRSWGVRTSLFLDAHTEQVESAKLVGVDRIELYTGRYAKEYHSNPKEAVTDHLNCSIRAQELNIGLNAGHDLNLDNLSYYSSQVHGLLEVSIGHALISDALYFGIANTIKMYRSKLM